MLYRDNKGSFIWVINMVNPDIVMMKDVMCFLENVKEYYIHTIGNTTLIFISFNVYGIIHILEYHRFPRSRVFQKFLQDISVTVPGSYISEEYCKKYDIQFTRDIVRDITDDNFIDKEEDVSIRDKYDLRYVSENVKVRGLDIPNEVYKKITSITGEKNKIPYHVCLSLCRISFEITDKNDNDYNIIQSMNFTDLYILIHTVMVDGIDDHLIELKYLLESEGQINMNNLDDQIKIEEIDPWVDDEDVDDIIGTEEIIDSSKVPESNYIKDVEGENNNGN